MWEARLTNWPGWKDYHYQLTLRPEEVPNSSNLARPERRARSRCGDIDPDNLGFRVNLGILLHRLLEGRQGFIGVVKFGDVDPKHLPSLVNKQRHRVMAEVHGLT